MGVYEIAHFLACNNSHLLTETEGNSMFCGPETVDVSGGERNEKIKRTSVDRRGSTKYTAFPRSQSISILLYTKSQINEKKVNLIRKYMKYFINFLRNVKFNSVHNVIHETFSRFSTVQRSGFS